MLVPSPLLLIFRPLTILHAQLLFLSHVRAYLLFVLEDQSLKELLAIYALIDVELERPFEYF